MSSGPSEATSARVAVRTAANATAQSRSSCEPREEGGELLGLAGAVMVRQRVTTRGFPHGLATAGPKHGKGAQRCNHGPGVPGRERQPPTGRLDERLGLSADAEQDRSLHRHRLEDL